MSHTNNINRPSCDVCFSRNWEEVQLGSASVLTRLNSVFVRRLLSLIHWLIDLKEAPGRRMLHIRRLRPRVTYYFQAVSGGGGREKKQQKKTAVTMINRQRNWSRTLELSGLFFNTVNCSHGSHTVRSSLPRFSYSVSVEMSTSRPSQLFI